jgi:hypothetical protein
MRTPEPGPLRVCLDCQMIIPYPPAGLTPTQLRNREYNRRIAGQPAEVAIACLDGDGRPAVMCVKCGQERYYQLNPHMRPPKPASNA